MGNIENNAKTMVYEEKEVKAVSGWAMFFITLLLYIGALALVIASAVSLDEEETAAGFAGLIIGIIWLAIGWFPVLGLKIMRPNEALVLTLFGKYIGSLKKEGFFFVNPFSTPANGTKLSLKTMTHNTEKQKIHDLSGNPIEVGIVITWRVVNTAKAVFNVQNFGTFLSIQADTTLRDVARCYPYDSTDSDEKTLRGSSVEVSNKLKELLQERVELAGLEIIEARIAHLAYAQEIAAAMLQRQQATAIIEARQKIVDGAVGMVEMALKKLSESSVCELDEERKAQMVSNLLVVLCGNKDAQPIVNSGSIY